MALSNRFFREACRWLGLALVLGATPSLVWAQSLTSGSLRGVVRTPTGEPVVGAQIALEEGAGRSIRRAETSETGEFQWTLVGPGEYQILIEQVGFQPVRRTQVLVASGQRTAVVVTIVRRPPPITMVEEQVETAVPFSVSAGRLLARSAIADFDRDQAVTGVGRDLSDVLSPSQRRAGLGISSGGLPISMARLYVDGQPEALLGHPAWRAEPLANPVFGRGAIDQVGVIGLATDGEWRGANGSTFAAQSRSGGNQIAFHPYATFSSAKLGTAKLDNPGDSAASSIQIGAELSGPLVKDTASFLLRVDYQALEEPGAFPWARDSSKYQGTALSLRQKLPEIANGNFGTDLAGAIAPPVRTWKGGNGFGRVDWQIGANQQLVARAGFAKWTERGNSFGDELQSGAGTKLEARDGSAGLSLTSTGDRAANEMRAGFNLARREYTGPQLPGTTLIDEGIGFGSSPTLPALFDRKAFEFSDAVQVRVGRHQLKVGANVDVVKYIQDYRFGTAGSFVFGNLDGFGLGQGVFSRVDAAAEQARFGTTDAALFLQDSWSVTPEIQLLLSVRYDRQKLPANKVTLNTAWQTQSGMRNDTPLEDSKGWSPRIGFVWDVQNRGDWVLRGGGGVHIGGIDPTVLAEAILFDRDVTVRRETGAFTSWPDLPSSGTVSSNGQRLTILNSSYRAPKTAKFDFAVTRRLGQTMLQVSAAYHHTDYLLRREDFNRVETAVGTTQEGRPVYGALLQYGGLVTPVIGSSRRFAAFDLVSGLSPTGFVDYYEITARLERRLSQGVTFVGSYTYSKTTDNLLGQRSADPADQLNPFPEGLNGADWSKGTSDFDVPHRASATLRFQSKGTTPITIAARYRIRSGLPFTPGFRPGVDPNADGSGANDPAYLDSNIAGLTGAFANATCDAAIGAFAARNSCREKMQQGLDLHLSLALPLKTGGERVALVVDGFNVVGTETGVIDRALVLVDPTRTLTTSGSGNVTVPLVGNPGFGGILARRGEARMVRFGLKVEY